MPVYKQFTETLLAACEAVETALARANIERTEAPSITQIAPQEHRYEVVAAAHYTGTDMRRVILACDRELAELLGDRAGTPDGTASAVDAGSTGLTWLGTMIREELVATLGSEHHDQPFIYHEAGRFRIRITGARNFLLRLPTAAGDLRVIVDLQPRSTRGSLFGSELGIGPGIIVEHKSQMGIEDKEVIDRIIKHLAHFEADIEIKVAVDRDHFRLLPATVLEAGFDREQGRFAVTATGLDLDQNDSWPSNEVDIIFFVQQKLLQASCSVIDLARGHLNENLHLPLLQLRCPELVSYGQRRGAFRIVPPGRLLGKIRRVVGEGGLDLEPAGEIAFRVQDVSYTGVRVDISVNTILSGMKWGAPVSCAIALPAPYRPVTVRGIVRSLIFNDATSSRGVSVGIEFLSDDATDTRGLKMLRRYIENHHRNNLKGGIELEPCRS